MARYPTRPDIALLDGRFYAHDPFPHFDWMRAHAPVFRDEAGGVWGITRHADVMQLSKRPELFCNGGSSRPDAPPIPSMINLDGAAHRRRRGIVSRGFTPRRVQEHAPHIRAICAALIDRARARGGVIDFVEAIAAPLPMMIIGDLLGVDPADHDRLLRWSDDLIGGLSSSAPVEALVAAQNAFLEYADYHRAVVADRRARPRDDLMSVLVHAEIDGERLDDEALLQESLLILVGGDETTRHVISGGMYALLRHPDQRALLAREPQRLPIAIEEMLRWVTPIQNMNRTATRDVTLHNETIRAGDKVLLLYPAANRDETVFTDPSRFDVTREPNPHVAFGGYGAHVCLGASLARLELLIMFEELLARAPDLELAGDDPPPLRPSNFIVGIEHLPVRFC